MQTPAANDIRAFLEAQAAKPKTHETVVAYSDGSVQRIQHNNPKSAANYADRYRPLIGKHQYISRATGKQISIVACEVVEL
jgi:hypothetical protein